MPLVDLDDPAELRARWSALAAVAHATGFDRRWYADDNGWYHQDETGSDLRMVRLDGARAVLFGFHTQHSRTGGADLLAGSPEWIGQPEVKRRMAAGQLGFVYGSFNGTWARAAYPGDPWQPLDDGFAPIAQWVTSDEEAARELIEWAAEWADYLGGLDELQPVGVALIRTAGSSGLTGDVLRDLFERLGIGPRSPQDPDLRAALVAAAQFGEGVVAEGALNAENLGRSGRMSAGYADSPGQSPSTGYAEGPGPVGYADSPGYAEPAGYGQTAESPRSGESAGYTEPAGYAQAPGRAEPAESPGSGESAGYAEPAGYAQAPGHAEPAESPGYAEPARYGQTAYGQPSGYGEPLGSEVAGAGETTGFVEPVDDDAVEEEELFVVPPGVSPFTGQLIAEGDQMIGEPFTPEPPITSEPPFPAEPPMRPDPPFTPDPAPYQPEPEPEPRHEPEGYGVTGKKPRRFGRKKKHEEGDPLAVLGLVGPAEPPQDQQPYEQAQYGQGQQPDEQAQYGPGQPYGPGDYGQGQQYGPVDQGQGQPYGQDQRGQGQPGPAPYEQAQYGQPSYGQDQYEPEGEPSPEHYLGDRRLPSAEPPRVGGPVEDGEDFYASLFADAPAAASYTPDVPTDAVPNWSADAPSPFTPLTNTPPSPSDDTGVLPPVEDTDPPYPDQQPADPPQPPYADQQPAATPESPYGDQQPASAPESPYAEQQATGTQEAARYAEHLPAEPHAAPFAATTQTPQPSPYPATDPTATHAPQQSAPSATPPTGPQAAQAPPSWSSDQAAHSEQPTVRHQDQAGPPWPADHPQAPAGQVLESVGAVADAPDDDDAPTAEIEAVIDAAAAEADEGADDPAQVSPEQLASGVDAEAGAGVAENRAAGVGAEARGTEADGGGDQAAGEADDTAAIPAVVDDDEAEEEYYPTDVSPFAPAGQSPFGPASEAADDDGHGRELPFVTNGFSAIDPSELQPGESGYEFGGEVFHDELIGEGDWTVDQLGDFQPPTPQPTAPEPPTTLENTSPAPAHTPATADASASEHASAPTPDPASTAASASAHDLASGPISTPAPEAAPASASTPAFAPDPSSRSTSAPASASAPAPASAALASGPTSAPDSASGDPAYAAGLASGPASAPDPAAAAAVASNPDLTTPGGTPTPDSRRETETRQTELRGDAASTLDTISAESAADVEVTAQIEAIRDDGPDQQSEEARSTESFEVDHRYDSLDAPVGRVEDGRGQDERLEAEDDFEAEQSRAEWGGQAEGQVEGEHAGGWIEPIGPRASADSAVRAAPLEPATSAERSAFRAAMSAEADARGAAISAEAGAPEASTPGEQNAREYAQAAQAAQAATVRSAEQEATPRDELEEPVPPTELQAPTAPAELEEPPPPVERLVAPPAGSGGVAIPGLGVVGADVPRVEPLPGSIEEAMRSEYERPRPRPKESAALEALREWCRARTRIVPSGFTIQVQVLDPDNPSYRFDLEPPEVDDPQYGADRLAGLLGDLWLAESQSEQGAWLFARLDAAGRTLRIDRWYDQVPEWWDHPIEQRLDVLGLVRRLNGRGPDWQPSYLEKLYTTAR